MGHENHTEILIGLYAVITYHMMSSSVSTANRILQIKTAVIKINTIVHFPPHRGSECQSLFIALPWCLQARYRLSVGHFGLSV